MSDNKVSDDKVSSERVKEVLGLYGDIALQADGLVAQLEDLARDIRQLLHADEAVTIGIMGQAWRDKENV